MYEYKAQVVKVIDGDTVDVDIDLGFGIWLKDERVRIMGIDTQKVVQEIKKKKSLEMPLRTGLKKCLAKTLF